MGDTEVPKSEPETTPQEQPEAHQQNAKPDEEHQLPQVARVVINQLFVILGLAFQYMGVDPSAAGNETQGDMVNLKEAKLAIDLSNLMLKNIEEQITKEESGAIEEILANARFRYVNLLKK